MTVMATGKPAERTVDTIAIGGECPHRARTQGFMVQCSRHEERERMTRTFSAPSPGGRVLDGDQHVTHFNRGILRSVLEDAGWRGEALRSFSTFAPFASVLGSQLAKRVSTLEDRIHLPLRTVLVAVARKT